MFAWAKILSGLVQLGNLLANWLKEKELVQTGKTLRKGEEDAETLNAVQKAKHARDNINHAGLDDELRID